MLSQLLMSMSLGKMSHARRKRLFTRNLFNVFCAQMGDHDEMKKLSSRICRDYLNGAWKEVTSDNIGFKHISGGLSNLLYHVSLPDHLITNTSHQQHDIISTVDDDDSKHSTTSSTGSATSSTNSNRGIGNSSTASNSEPREVLIRVYGQTHGERALESLITESVIFTLLSERGLGPKLHGIFPGGRIEQYINARPLKTRELADVRLSRQIAQKMAIIHTMEVPLHKEPRWLWDTMTRWMKTCDKRLVGTIPEHCRKILMGTKLSAEYDWLKERVNAEQCSVVFCHNDMQEGNILMCLDESENGSTEELDESSVSDEDVEPKLVLIDFEYCSYNYRSFDLANHFLEWTYDYTAELHPFYKESTVNYPSETQRLEFIRTYLAECNSDEDPVRILQEVQLFTLASHLFWTMWSIVNAEMSQIPFGYWEYGATRLAAYKRAKADLLKNQAQKRKAED